MTGGPAPVLVLGLGNDLLGDDAIGLLAARQLRGLDLEQVCVEESAGVGFELFDFLEGRERALLLDAIATGRHPPGTLLEFSAADFQAPLPASPHYAGLPEMLRLAGELGIPFPGEIRVLACEVADPYRIRVGLSQEAARALPAYVSRAREIIAWQQRRSPRAQEEVAWPSSS